MTDPHKHLPARLLVPGDEFWHERWLWECALAEFTMRQGRPRVMVRARSVAPPHHYATVGLDPEETVAYLHKEHA